ncbi:MAG: hypothetical protein AMJ65_14540 [Phycisphaerae bacterium SG8_4]|nr:MAG: hypothetical protein AMJ65_14540 [Phycisphaerae bacterium SG8_4]
MRQTAERTGEGFKGKRPLFSLGHLAATTGALELLQKDADLAALLIKRHELGDWGDVDSEDWATNNRSLKLGGRIVSSYKLLGAGTLWIITEADRSCTTLLLPSEY